MLVDRIKKITDWKSKFAFDSKIEFNSNNNLPKADTASWCEWAHSQLPWEQLSQVNKFQLNISAWKFYRFCLKNDFQKNALKYAYYHCENKL